MADGVSVKHRPVVAAWRRDGEAWVKLVTPQRGDDARWLAALEAVSEPDEDEGIYAQLGSTTPDGYVTLVDRVPDAARLEEWLDRLAAELADRAFTGTLTAARSAPRTPWLYGGPHGWKSTHRWSPGSFCQWTADHSQFTGLDNNPSITGVWPQPPGLISEICAAAAAWVSQGGPEIVVTRGAFGVPFSDPGDLPAVLTLAAERAESSTTACSDPARLHGRQVELRAGTAVHQVLGEVDHWRDRVDPLREAITTHGHLVDLAIVRTMPTGGSDVRDLDGRDPYPEVRGGHLPVHRHLMVEYTPDANGIQILTDSHLDKAHDLSDWTIADLGHGRHLVEAPDLSPWYEHDRIDPDTLARARHDFGAMILTPDTFEARPPPWFFDT